MDFRELEEPRPQVDAPKEKARAVARPQIAHARRAAAARVAAPELLRSVLKELLAKLRCARPTAADATSREACVLCVHSFWYTFCALHQPGSEAEQAALLKMMSQQVARLAQRRCGRAAFFTHFPPLLAHAVLAALGRNGLLPPPAQPTSAAVLRHLALLGGSLPPLLLNKHLELAARAAHASSGDAAFFTPPKPDAHARLPPPLATCALPRCTARPAPRRPRRPGARRSKRRSRGASNSELLAMAAEAASSRARPRPRRVLADLHRRARSSPSSPAARRRPLSMRRRAPPSPPRPGLSTASSAPSLGAAASVAPPRFGATRFAQVQQARPASAARARASAASRATARSARRRRATRWRARRARKTFRRANAQNRREEGRRLAAEEAAAALDAQRDEILGRPRRSSPSSRRGWPRASTTATSRSDVVGGGGDRAGDIVVIIRPELGALQRHLQCSTRPARGPRISYIERPRRSPRRAGAAGRRIAGRPPAFGSSKAA